MCVCVPQRKMPADSLTKAAWVSTNGAIDNFFRTGTCALVQEEEALKCRSARRHGRQVVAPERCAFP